MPTPITFTLTNAGLNAALDANANGLTISLTQIAIGSGKYTPLATRTALQTELARYPLSGGDIEPNSKTLRFSAVIESATTRQAFEVGLFTSTGVLFAVASTTDTDPLILVTANIAFVAAFGMVVSEIPAGSLTVVTDPNAPLAIALINQHLAAANPHAQYAMKAAFDSHVTQNTTEHTNLANLISAEATARANADTAHTAAANPHPQYALYSAFIAAIESLQEQLDMTQLAAVVTAINQAFTQLNKSLPKVGDIKSTAAAMSAAAFTAAQNDGSAWEVYGAGRTIVGAGSVTIDYSAATGDAARSNKTQSFTAGSTGGEIDHKQTTAELRNHGHVVKTGGADATSTNPSGGALHAENNSGSGSRDGAVAAETGSSQPFNIMQPYIVASQFLCVTAATPIPAIVL